MTIKLCCACTHFSRDSNGCRRKIRPVGIELVHGRVIYSTTKELNAWSERASWFGCGKTGKYWRPAPSD
jgi:hypothetical protein